MIFRITQEEKYSHSDVVDEYSKLKYCVDKNLQQLDKETFEGTY